MKQLLKITGILACVAALGLNLQYALNGYGIKSGKMHLVVLAQSGTNTSKSGSSSSKPPKTCKAKTQYLDINEMCCTNPVLYYKKSGFSHSRETGNFLTYQEGFKGKVYNQCSNAPNSSGDIDTVTTKNC